MMDGQSGVADIRLSVKTFHNLLRYLPEVTIVYKFHIVVHIVLNNFRRYTFYNVYFNNEFVRYNKKPVNLW